MNTSKDPQIIAEKEWKEKLTSEQYHVLREKGTEAPFTGKFYDHHDNGMYICAACGQELFASGSKFESGSGWPSFDGPANAASVSVEDDTSAGMKRKEVLCQRCGGHLGHVFDDGPAETTGKRFCINSCALDFKKN